MLVMDVDTIPGNVMMCIMTVDDADTLAMMGRDSWELTSRFF